MKVEVRIPGGLRTAKQLTDVRGLQAAAEAACEVVQKRMFEIIDGRFRGSPRRARTGALSNKASWPIRPFGTPKPGAEMSTNVPYAAATNYSYRLGRVLFLQRAVADTSRERIQAAVEAWRRERGR